MGFFYKDNDGDEKDQITELNAWLKLQDFSCGPINH